MVIGANALRALLCLVMIGDLNSNLLFPEAFAILVLAKSYHVAKSAIVPTVVRSDEELVEANLLPVVPVRGHGLRRRGAGDRRQRWREARACCWSPRSCSPPRPCWA